MCWFKNRKRLFGLIGCLILAELTLVSKGFTQGDYREKAFSSIDFTPLVSDGSDAKFLSVLSSEEAVTLKSKLTPKERNSEIDYWNLRTQKITFRISLPLVLDTDNAAVSTDLQQAVFFENIGVRPPHKLLVFSFRTRKFLKPINFGPHVTLENVAYLPHHGSVVAVIAYNGNVRTSSLMLVNVISGKIIHPSRKTIAWLYNTPYALAVSSDGAKMVGISGEPNVLDVIDVNTGRALATLSDSDLHPIEAPLFFLSQDKIVCNNFIYNLKDKTALPIFVPAYTEEPCIAGLPQHPGYGFFLSTNGLELWNITQKQMLHRWPSIRDSRDIYFSPDGTVMVVGDHEQVYQVWNFDVRTLGGH